MKQPGYDSLIYAQNRRIIEIKRIFYVFQDNIEESDGPLELGLEDGSHLLLRGGGDGERLVVEEKAWTDPFAEPLSPENKLYIEQYGVWRKFDVTQNWRYSQILGKPVTYTLLINDFNTVGGVHLQTDSAEMWFVIEFDEEILYWQSPEGFRPA